MRQVCYFPFLCRRLCSCYCDGFGLDNVGGYDDNSSCDDVDYGGTAGDCDFGILGVTPISNITSLTFTFCIIIVIMLIAKFLNSL